MPKTTTVDQTCSHGDVKCINPYELIRKYECVECGRIVMCDCDRAFGERFFPHQLGRATTTHSRRHVPVTGGFQPGICNECRGLPAEPAPKSRRYGSTSQILRYYWREIYFETTRRFADWVEDHGYSDRAKAAVAHKHVRERIAHEVREEIKKRHQEDPKYVFESREAQDEFLARCGIEKIDLIATYVKPTAGKSLVVGDHGTGISVEQFVTNYFQAQGGHVLVTESRPFHVLFGTFMWLLIQDPADPMCQVSGFGERGAFDRGEKGLIWTLLPKDFGVPGYAERRKEAIDEHFETMIPETTDELLWWFDYWIEPSFDFRNYLWAHQERDVTTARAILSTLPAETIRQILRFLVEDYWDRYLGWPDLLVQLGPQWFFAEVKSSGDSLSDAQRSWLEQSRNLLMLPTKVVKVHKGRVIDSQVPTPT